MSRDSSEFLGKCMFTQRCRYSLTHLLTEWLESDQASLRENEAGDAARNQGEIGALFEFSAAALTAPQLASLAIR